MNRQLTVFLLSLGYFVLASGTILTTRLDGSFAFVWAANALLLADLILRPRKSWWPSLAGAAGASFLSTSLFGFGLASAVPLMLANVLEVFLGAYLLRRMRTRSDGFDSLAATGAFILAAGILAPAASSLIAGASAAASGQPFWASAGRWYVAHALGALIFTPILVYALKGDVRRWTRGAGSAAAWRHAAALVGVALCTGLVFAQDRFPLLFLPMLPVMIATFRMGRFGAASSIVVLAVIGGGATIMGHGPVSLIDTSDGARLQFLQLYLAVSSLIVLPVAADLARRKQLFQQLTESEARYRMLAAQSSDIVMNIDREGIIRYVSPSIERLGGHGADDLIGRNGMQLVHAEDRALVYAAHQQIFEAPHRTHIFEYRGLAADGRTLWMETNARGVLDGGGRAIGIVSTIRDIAHRKRREDELARAADTDPLTGLLNRRGAENALVERRTAGMASGAIAMFDIDFFKTVNDTYGHEAGDGVIRAFAIILQRMVRPGDLVARLGGEEFAVFFAGVSAHQAMNICDRVRLAAEAETVMTGSGQVRITVSGGVAEFDGGTELSAALKAADAALYEAKALGRNRLRLASRAA